MSSTFTLRRRACLLAFALLGHATALKVAA